MGYDPDLNPDIDNYNITETPVMIITGSDDTDVEPELSAWYDFQMMQTPNKVFVNVHGADHYDKDDAQASGPFMAYFAQKWSLDNHSAGLEVCGNRTTSLQNNLDLGYPGDINNGGEGNDTGQVSFLCCDANGRAEPTEYVSYCRANLTAPFW